MMLKNYIIINEMVNLSKKYTNSNNRFTYNNYSLELVEYLENYNRESQGFLKSKKIL